MSDPSLEAVEKRLRQVIDGLVVAEEHLSLLNEVGLALGNGTANRWIACRQLIGTTIGLLSLERRELEARARGGRS